MKQLILACFLFCFHIGAVTIGSDTAVNRFTTQQTLNNTDRVAGFAALQAGFFINGPAVTAQWDTFFPVSGNLDLGAGTLTLTRNLVAADVTNLARMGNIVGNGYAFDLSCSMTQMPASVPSANRCCIQQVVNSVRSAAVNSIDWAFDNQLLAIGLNTTSNNLIIVQFNGTIITTLTTNTLPQVINAVRWSPSAYNLAVGTVAGGASQLYTYQVNPTTGVLTNVSSVSVGGGDVRSIGWRPQADFLAVGTTTNLQQIKSYPITNAAALGTPTNISTTVSMQNLAVDWDAAGVNVGFGTLVSGSTPELQVYAFNAGASTLTLNASNNWGSVVSGVSFNKVYPNQLAMCAQGGNPRLVIFNYNQGAGTLTQITSAAENNNQANQVMWAPSGTCLALAKQASGTTTELNMYYFDQSTNALYLFGVETGTNISDVRWSPSGSYLAIGDRSNNVRIYLALDGLAMNSCFTWSNICVQLDSNVFLSNACINFSGVCTIDGNNNTLSLSPTSTLRILPNSSLLIKNITLAGLTTNGLQATDFTSSITFSNVDLILSNDFNFQSGQFDVNNNLLVTGAGYSFVYTSSALSRILPNSIMTFDANVTFSYAPVVNQNNFFSLADQTSILSLNGATVYASAAGLQLTKGILLCGQNSVLATQGNLLSQAIQFGDGVSAANNLLVHILPSAILDIQGIVVDACV